MLLDNLLETGVVELRELGQIVHICDDIAHVFLQQFEVLLRGYLVSIAAAGL